MTVFNDLMRHETKATLAMMVEDLLGDRERVIELSPLVSFTYDVLTAMAGKRDMAKAVEEAALVAGLIEEANYSPEIHYPHYFTSETPNVGEAGYALTDDAVNALRVRV